MCPLVPLWGLCVAAVELASWRHGPGAGALVCHAVLAFATRAVWARLGRPALQAERAACLALALPVAGALVAACLPAPLGSPPAAESLEPPADPWLGAPERAPLPARGRGLWELVPDLLAGDLEARLAAIRGLATLETADAVRALRWALESPDQQATLLAALALADLEETCERDVAAARTRLAREGDVAAGELAAVLCRQAASGLLSPVAAAECWREVAILAGRARVADPVDPAVAVHLAVASLALDRPAEALAAAEAALALQADHAEAELVRLEALYALGEVDRLRQEARRVASALPGTPACEVALLWRDGHAVV